MRRLVETPLLVLVLIYFQNGISQTIKLDSLQIERVFKVSQLWGHIKYFHPYLSDANIDWESAFTQNIRHVIDAEDKDEFGDVVQKMLNHLNDPVTQVTSTSKAAIDAFKETFPTIKFIQDSTLLVSVNNYHDLNDFNFAISQFFSLTEKMPLSKGIIFDLRSSIELGDLKGWLGFYFKLIEQHFSTTPLRMPGLRARFHDGFVPETGGPSGGYSSGFYVIGGDEIRPDPNASDNRYIFLVNRNSDIPRIALALQSAGKAKILSTEPLTDAFFVETALFDLDEGCQVKIRLNELAIDNELTQYSKSYPDLGHRLLAVAKIWTVIDYFFAYKDLMEHDWDEVLRAFIPRIALATDSLEFNLTIAEMYRHIQDGHGSIQSTVLSEYFGTAFPPIVARFIEGSPIVTWILPDSLNSNRGIEVGDIIREIDGERVKDRVARYAKYLSASNESALYEYIAQRFLAGNDSSSVKLKIEKENGRIEYHILPRYNRYSDLYWENRSARNDQPVTRLIDSDIAYADLDRLTVEMVSGMFDDFKETKAIIFDMRGHPNGTAWEIAPHLTSKNEVYAANFRRYSPMGMNFVNELKNMTFFNQTIPKAKYPKYDGITVMLIDERTQSQAEHTGLFFEAANNTKFIGSQTAGANGNVTEFIIPGNITLSFSGQDVRHIDGRQLQQIGLVPDVKVKPTIKGIRAGKDEVLETAIGYLHTILKD
jgi:C-terminal processing protease CtpA/Prc